MSQQPIIYAKSKVFCPNVAFDQHPAVQQYLSEVPQELFDRLRAIVVLRTKDVKRLFGEETVSGFYLISPAGLSYIAPRVHDLREYKDDEVMADVFVIPNHALDQIVSCGSARLMDEFNKEYNEDEVPSLRMKVLVQGVDVLLATKPELAARLSVIDYGTWCFPGASIRFDFDLLHWIENPPDVDPDETVVEQKRIHLKDVPLDIRNGRRMVRASIEANGESLTNMFIKSGAQLTFDEWMETSQGVNMKVLKELEKIDNLPDDEYVKAMMAFKKGEAQAYHSQQLKDGKTTLHLLDWTLENFGVEFEQLGRKEALAEVLSIEDEFPEQLDGDEDEDLSPAVFLIAFDGTIVEDRAPRIGPETPFAIPVLKKLIEKGHQVIILSDRDTDSRGAMLDFLKNSGVEVIGATFSFHADGVVHGDQIYHVKDPANVSEEYVIDYIIDHRFFGAPMIQISGRADHGSTLFWAKLVGDMTDTGYLTQEEVDEIQASLSEDQ